MIYRKEDIENRDFHFSLAIDKAIERGFEVERKDDFLYLSIKNQVYKIGFYPKNKTLILFYDEEREFEFYEMTDLIDTILI